MFKLSMTDLVQYLIGLLITAGLYFTISSNAIEMDSRDARAIGET